MNMKNWKEKLLEKKREILNVCPQCDDESGIYVFVRQEGGFRFAYVGQAKHLLTRLAQHLLGYDQHIDKSLRKHKLRSMVNDTGWELMIFHFRIEELDKQEKDFELRFSNAGYQLLNKTSGGQGKGKVDIAERKPTKTYRDGIAYGYEKARKEVISMFKYLTFDQKGFGVRPTNAKLRFLEFIGGNDEIKKNGGDSA